MHISFPRIFSAECTAGSLVTYILLHLIFLTAFIRRSSTVHTSIYTFISSPFHPDDYTHDTDCRPSISLHVRHDTHGTLLTDGARPKLKGISHLGRIRVRSFPDITIRVPTPYSSIDDSTIRFASDHSSSSYAKVSIPQVCPTSLVVHPPGRGNPIAGHVHNSAGSVGSYSLRGLRIVRRSSCFRG